MSRHRTWPVESDKWGLYCPHCGNILLAAVQTIEGDRLCEHCCEEIRGMPSSKCTKCGMSVPPGSEVYPDRAARREISQLIVYCPYKDTGCRWEGRLKDMEEHALQCSFKRVKCPHTGCEVWMTASQLEFHVRECVYRQVKCKYCGRQMQYNRLGQHYERICQEYSEPCKQCGKAVSRKDMPHHMEEVCDQTEHHRFEAEYTEALKHGEAPVAYARVMFLGPGGSGKSSLLDGLTNNPLHLAESTALADIVNIKYHWVEAANAAEGFWRVMGEEDEVQELASLGHLARKSEIQRPQSEEAGMVAPPLYTNASKKASKIQRKLIKKVIQKAWEKHQQQQQQQQQRQQRQRRQQRQQRQQRQRRQRQEHHGQQQRQQWRQQQRQQQQRWQQQQQRQQQQRLQQLQQELLLGPSKGQEVMMRIWDCGGQPVFLDILSAFLSSRTMFLLIFNASQPLNSRCQETWRHNGCTYQGKELNITFHQLMMQWMRLIHAGLVAKNEMGTVVKEAAASQSEATTEKKQPTSLPLCPRIMIIGTHGDAISSVQAQQVLKELDSSFREKAFRDLILKKLIVDNTTAGGGKNEDPGYKRIRKTIHEFTRSLTAPTPLAWVTFRSVVQKAAVNSPVLSYEQVTTIAETCGIAKSKVPSVLHFYHQLGVFLHYKKIESLSTTIIAEPRWLIKQLCKLFMPEWYLPRPQNLSNLWEWLEGKGVLLEDLYENVWGDCGLKEGAKALVDLLEHFDLAAKIGPVSKEMEWYKGCKYFVPCMLKARSQEDPGSDTEKVTGQPQEFIHKAATLHITFNTGYIPPGFFVRLAAQMTKSKKCTPIFGRGVYRDSITFHYEEIDRVTITESKSLVSVQVDMIRVAKRTHDKSRFADSCVSFRDELSVMCKEVLCWLPTVKLDFAFRCRCTATEVEHFATINDEQNRNSQLSCSQDTLYQMDSEHKYWLPPAPLPQQPNTETPTRIERENVAREVKTRGCISDLAREMEVEYSLDETSPEYAMISDWVTHEKGTRYKLAEHLREAGLTRISTMLLNGDMQVSSDSSPHQMGSTGAPRRHDRPSLPLLLQFPTKHKKLNIIERIGTHYSMLGTLLLNDDDYAITSSIAEQFNNNAFKINFEVLTRWIQGKGKDPVTWETLAEVLECMKLSELATEVSDSLQ